MNDEYCPCNHAAISDIISMSRVLEQIRGRDPTMQKRRFFTIGPIAAVLLISILWIFCAHAGESQGPFEVWIELFLEYTESTSYYKPASSVIKVTPTMRLHPFKLVLKNISKDTQQLSIDAKQGSQDYISFEVTDENNNSAVITKKVDTSKSNMPTYIYIGPGKRKEFEIFMSPADWENAGSLVNKGARRLHARAVYKSGSKKFCSDYYDFIIED
jgi:hypothetical protein